jgi:hypothetical protein
MCMCICICVCICICHMHVHVSYMHMHMCMYLGRRRTSEEYRKEVEREVEGRLQQEIEDLRGHRPTDWNRSVAAKLLEHTLYPPQP